MLVRIAAYFRPYWLQGLVTLLTVAVISIIGLATPLLIRTIIDVALPNGDTSLLAVLVLAMVAAPTVGGLLGVLQTYLNAQIAQRVMFDLRNAGKHLSLGGAAFPK